MPDTVRDQVIAAFCTKVGATRCTKLDGASDLPARSVWDRSEEITKTQYGAVTATMPLPVESLALVDLVTYPTVSHQANAMLGAVIQAATAGDNTLGGLCQRIEYSASEMIYPESGANEIEVYAVFTVTYQYGVGDPFTAA